MELNKENLNELYWNQKLSTLAIGKIFGVSCSTIANRMRGFGLKLRTAGEYLKGHHMPDESKRKISEAQIGEKSNNWKGGRSIDGHGYIRITIPIDSPYLPMAHKSHTRKRMRDITEHRLIMAQYLGRCLEPFEIVHHKNGIKTDNRIDNLELMTHVIDHSPSMNYQRYIEQVKKEANEQGKRDLLEALRKGGGVVKDGELKNAVGLFVEDGIAKALNLNGKLIFISDDEAKQ